MTNTNPYTSAFTSGSTAQHAVSAQAFNATHATVDGRMFQPIKQTDPSQYSRAALENKQGSTACYAAVQTMIARSTGNPTVTVDQFYTYQASLPKNVSIGGSMPLSIANHLPSGAELLIIKGTVEKRDGSGREDHFMLGTHLAGPDGQKIIIANDPWTGGQVQINAGNGKVMDTNYPLTSFTADAFQPVNIN